MGPEELANTTQARAPSPMERKRSLKAERDGVEAKQAKRSPKVANNGWGELFKNRDNFVAMHIV